MNPQQRTEIEAEVFRKLTEWLQQRTDVQNIDLMILAGFCRNCLAKWYRAAAENRGIEMNYAAAQEIVYGMPYSEWKTKYQQETSQAQLAAFERAPKAHE